MGHWTVLGVILSSASELESDPYTLRLPPLLSKPRRNRVTARMAASISHAVARLSYQGTRR